LLTIHIIHKKQIAFPLYYKVRNYQNEYPKEIPPESTDLFFTKKGQRAVLIVKPPSLG
jgi:hypothetical protein